MAGGFEGPLMTEEEAEDAWLRRRDHARAVLDRTAQAVDGVVDSHLIISSDDPGPALVQYAVAAKADVVVVGASSKGAIRADPDELGERPPRPSLTLSGARRAAASSGLAELTCDIGHTVDPWASTSRRCCHA